MNLYSYDLSAATDRLPLEVQEVSLRILFGKEVSSTWFELMKKMKFFTRLTGKPSRVSYKVGQGIGILSSWSSLAVTHHLLIRFAAYKVGIKSYSDYLVLGDDVVISGELVSKSYYNLIQSIGVEISIPKSVVPGPNGKVRAEFASRLIVGKIDYSPFPVGVIILSDLYSQISLVTNLMERLLAASASRVLVVQDDFLNTILRAVFGPS